MSVRLWNPGIVLNPSIPTITQNHCLGNIPFFYDYPSFLKFTFGFHTFFNCILLLFVTFFTHLLLIFVIFAFHFSLRQRLQTDSRKLTVLNLFFYQRTLLNFLNMFHPRYSSIFKDNNDNDDDDDVDDDN